ncbi:hypothetical protein ACWHAM_25625 [Paenibacillus terrae]
MIDFQFILEMFDRGLVGIVFGGIIGYTISLYFKSRKKLSFQSNSLLFHITKRYPISYSKQYKGIYTSKLTRSIYFVWNSGNQVIERNDISSIEPLRIGVKGNSQIIDAKLLKTCREANNIRVTSDNEQAKLTFDYLNPNDGCVIEIIHTSKKRPFIVGEIKGISKGITNYGDIFFFSGRQGARIASLFLIVMTSLLYLLYIITGIIPPKIGTKEGLYIYLALGYFISIITLIFSHRNFPSQLKIDLNEMARTKYNDCI